MDKVTLMLCLLLTVLGLSRSQDGCPKLEAGIVGTCSESCSDDDDCEFGQKCCSNGCGHECTACVTVTCTQPGCYVAEDSKGCEYCQCDDVQLSCDTVDCPEGQMCVLLEAQCVRAPCPSVPQCIGKPKCSPINCTPNCPRKKGPDGCDFCDCRDPCENCTKDQECELLSLPCDRSDCLPPIGICKDKPKCPPVSCSPDCVIKQDPNGCEYCDCGAPCKHCRKDQDCEIFYPPCAGPPCPPPVGVCKDKPKCPPVSCGSNCPPKKGPDGCEYCDCKDPCQHCTKDQECEVLYPSCAGPPCLPIGVCKDKSKCPPVSCSPDCVIKQDPNGCEYCDCGAPCKHCRKDQDCEIFYPPCAGPPCPPPVGVCKDKPKCPPVSCGSNCPPKKGPDGCEYCDCKDPCQHCTKDQECEVLYPSCAGPPCLPIGVCKDKPKCPPVSCSPDCVIKQDPNGCEYCDCGAPCKHCRKDQDCEIFYPPCAGPPCPPPVGVCKDKPKCPPVSCGSNCPPKKGPDGCEYCDCKDPCQHCTKDQECEVLYPSCAGPPCLPIGVCKDKSKCPPVSCSPDCVIKQDPNGCEYCDCGAPCKHCRKDQDCEIFYPPCAGPPCPPPVGVCKDKPKCPPVSCGSNCPPKKGPDGCEYCDCKDPCQHCTKDQECEVLYPSCAGPPCLPIGVCKDKPKCPPVSCSPDCVIKQDPNGCEYCDCGAPCKHCRKDQDCEIFYPPCAGPPCPPPVGVCKDKPKCPPVSCGSNCPPKKGPDGCEYCDCKDPCQHCTKDQECEVLYPSCAGPPCLPIGVCKDKPKCPPVSCSPDCVIKQDPNGCEYCDCGAPCKHCRKDQDCEIFYPPCAGPPCPPPVGVCKDKPKCPPVSCGSNCPPKKGPDGCEYCDCKDPCQHCTKDQECEVLYPSCAGPPCLPIGVCKDKPKCPPVSCSPDCVIKQDPNGCEYCDCGAPCKHCRKDQDCEIFYPPCAGPPCPPPVGVCKDKPKCPPVSCGSNCPPKKGPDGCEYCDCKDPCQHCTKDQECEVLYPSCAGPPCLPIGVCKDKSKCPPVSCSPDCVIKQDPNGCEYCDCGAPCKHCRKDQDCEIFYPPCAGPPCPPPVGVCKDKPKCPPVSCGSNCPPKKGPDGCEYCDCKDPCQHCTKDQECEVLYPSCARPPCLPIGVCKDKPKCPLVSCSPDCVIKQDPNGCEYCDCGAPCKHCRKDEDCEIFYPPCAGPPCPPPVGVCKDKPKCPLVRCTPECPPHKGPDGCTFCDCKNPCQDCSPGQICDVIHPVCIDPPCLPPIGICTDPPAPPVDKRCTSRPRLTPCFFRFGYKFIYDVNYGRCRRLRRRTCSTGLNRFRTMEECEDACQAKPADVRPVIQPPIIVRPGEKDLPVGGDIWSLK